MSEVMATIPAPAAPVGAEVEARMSRLAEMKKVFQAMPKVVVRVPEDTKVRINGYGFMIQGGKRVEVPELVAEVLEQAGLY